MSRKATKFNLVALPALAFGAAVNIICGHRGRTGHFSGECSGGRWGLWETSRRQRRRSAVAVALRDRAGPLGLGPGRPAPRIYADISPAGRSATPPRNAARRRRLDRRTTVTRAATAPGCSRAPSTTRPVHSARRGSRWPRVSAAATVRPRRCSSGPNSPVSPWISTSGLRSVSAAPPAARSGSTVSSSTRRWSSRRAPRRTR